MSISKSHRGRIIFGYLLIVPALLSVLVSTITPAAMNVVLSFMKWDGFSPAVWNGLDNYKRIFSDQATVTSFVNSLKIACYVTVGAVFAGILFAFLIQRMKRLEGSFYRLVLYLPVMLPMTVVALLFSLIYNYDMGLLNAFLRTIGLDRLAHAWLADSSVIVQAISFVGIWKQSGLTMMLTYTAISSIPESFNDVCRLEGCGPVRKVFMITLPLIWPTIRTALVLTLIFSFRMYDLVWVLTKGGPGNLSTIVPIRILEYGFKYNQFGTASSIGTIFMILVICVVQIVKRITRSEAYEY